MLLPTIKGKARRREGDAAGEGKRFRRSRFYLFFIENEEGRGWPMVACYLKGTRFFDRGGMIAGPSPRFARWPIGIAAFGLCLPFIYNKKFRLGPGKRRQQQKGRGPCSCCARPLLSQWGSRFGIY